MLGRYVDLKKMSKNNSNFQEIYMSQLKVYMVLRIFNLHKGKVI
jgi:hypothetical protein